MESRKFEVSEKPTALVGSLSKTEYITVGHFQRLEIQKVITTDLITNSKSTFVRFELSIEGYSGTEVKIASLSYQETESLINSLKAFQEKVITTRPNVYTEVNYTTDDFKAGCYYSRQEWTIFLKLNNHDDNTYVVVPEEDVNKLIGLLENTKA